MKRQNCWEVTSCGREVGGRRVDELGVCPAATETCLDGQNHGTNAGRACWAVAGTFCQGEVQGLNAKVHDCVTCSFYEQVIDEEVPDFVFTPKLLSILESRGRPADEPPS